MKFVDSKELTFVILTTEEEETFAQWTMDLLSAVWFDKRNSKKFYTLVMRIYWAKCAIGGDLSAHAYEKLWKFVDKSNVETEANESMPESIKEKWRIPTDGIKFGPRSGGRNLPIFNGSGEKYTKEEQIRIYQQETRNIWRGVWREHTRLQRSSERFLVFPGDDQGEAYRLVQEEKERRFWGAVERRAKEWDLSRSDAVKALADCVPRGDVPDSDRAKFEPPKSLLEFMEVEDQEEVNDLSDFDYYFPEMDTEADHF